MKIYILIENWLKDIVNIIKVYKLENILLRDFQNETKELNFFNSVLILVDWKFFNYYEYILTVTRHTFQ